LSENPNFTVAVIEAGEYVTDMQSILVPGMYQTNFSTKQCLRILDRF